MTVFSEYSLHPGSSYGNDSSAGSGYATSSGSGSGLGHSWIQYNQDSGESHTYGAWQPNNNRNFMEGGLGTDLEKHEPWNQARSIWIDDAAEKRLNDVIKQFQDQGPAAWQLNQNCTNFSSKAWKAGTGENLNPGSPIGTPKSIGDSINRLNQGTNFVRVPKP